MSPRVRPIPEGYATVTPYLITSSAARATAAGAKVIRPVHRSAALHG